MINNTFFKLSSIGCNIKQDECLSQHTTLGIGGKADYFVEVSNEKQLIDLLKIIKENNINFFIIGGGSNVLFSDNGFNGVVIKLTGDFCKYEINENNVTAGAGVGLGFLVVETSKVSLSGLENLVAIPGTVGGAVFGNAGVKNYSISNILKKVEVIDYNGNKKILEAKEINFGYRKSSIKNCIITRAFFILKKADKNDILKAISQELKNRKDTQPIGTKSAGCVFKNPANDSAGRLIDSLNLKNYNIGDIVISDKHANFFVNKNNGTCKDMISLVEFVKKEVNKKYNINLETEIKIIK